jgi:integrase
VVGKDTVFRVHRKPVVTVYVRHRGECRDRSTGEFYRGCDCAKWLRYSLNGKQHRIPANTRAWGHAEEKAQELQKRLDAGASGLASTSIQSPTPRTIAAAVETYILAKQGENKSSATITKLRYQLGSFEKFMAARSKFFPTDITPDDAVEFRATWKTMNDITRIKFNSNLRGFLKRCCPKETRDDVLDAISPIKQTREGMARRKPKPFSEKEISQLLAQVPVSFPDAAKASRVTALIHLQIGTGLAVRDAVQLERANFNDGWLRIKRQKTGSNVVQKLDTDLHRELLTVLNGNPRYVFWDGKTLPTSAVGTWLKDVRKLMSDAGLWTKGDLSHRFRDTFVDYMYGAGCSVGEIAAMIGDRETTVEKHYKDMFSKRMEERLAKLPVRSWSQGAQNAG